MFLQKLKIVIFDITELGLCNYLIYIE